MRAFFAFGKKVSFPPPNLPLAFELVHSSGLKVYLKTVQFFYKIFLNLKANLILMVRVTNFQIPLRLVDDKNSSGLQLNFKMV